MASAEEIRDGQRAAWAGLSEGLGVADDHQYLDVAAGTGEPGLTIAKMAPNARVVLTDLVPRAQSPR